MHKLLPLLLCLGCASSAPTTYNQSAFAPTPRPPAFSPSEDAPHTFGPEEPRHTVEPQPKPTRYLPQTDKTRSEPTIWAAKPPPGEDGFIEVLNEFLRAPKEDDEKFEDERKHVEACAKHVDGNVRNLMGDSYVNRMDYRVRACLARELMGECLALRHHQYTVRGERTSRQPGADRAKVIIERDKDKVCTDSVLPFMRAELNRLSDAGYR